MKTTNYYDTFISVAEDSISIAGEIPPVKVDDKSMAQIEFEMLSRHPYTYTSDDVLFEVYAIKHNIL